MHGDEVGLADQLLDRLDEAHAELAGPLRADERVVRDERHAEGERALGHEHADPAQAEQFTAAIGLFPTGSIIELSSGEVGIVTRQNPTRRLRPEIVLILEADKSRRAHLEVLDPLTEEFLTDGTPGRWIRRELPRGAYDIKAEDFFL